MGQNLVLNMVDHGYRVAVYNRTPSRTTEFAAAAGDAEIHPYYDVPSLAASLTSPRIVLLMVKAGPPVDEQIDQLLPHLDPGDVIIDGGNSLFTDTERRTAALAQVGVRFVGAGISGGEEGARHGPSIMPGGDPGAWPIVESIITSVAAKVDGEPMAAWIGPGGAGHFVKMVHNGIEYGDMQVIAEAYDVMRRGMGLSVDAMHDHFERWSEGALDSFLIDITTDILTHHEADGTPTLDVILDAAGQKGTGKWTVIASMEEGMPVTLVGESVYARMVSALVEDRAVAADRFGDAIDTSPFDAPGAVDDLHDALYASKIISYAQGMMLIDAGSHAHGWDIDAGTVASIWRAGCIIRSRFLADITAAYRADPDVRNLLLTDVFAEAVSAATPGWRRTVARAVRAGIPVPAYASALSFYDAYRSKRLPANLIQAQRDYFGAHTYERTDRDRGTWYHTNWSGRGGAVTSGSYDA